MSELDHPLLGRLTLEDECLWVGTIQLPAMATCARSDYPAHSSQEIQLCLETSDGGPPSAAQEAAYRKLQEHEQTILAEFVQRQFYEYLHLGGFFRLDPKDRKAGFLPRISEPDDLRNRMSLKSVMIHETDRGDCAAATLWFDCVWDEEHGQEIEVHDGKIADEYLPAEPWRLPQEIDLSDAPLDDDGYRRVELLIGKKWRGIFVVDGERRCLTGINGTPATAIFGRIGSSDVSGARAVSNYERFHATLPRETIEFVSGLVLWLAIVPGLVYGWMYAPAWLAATAIGASAIILLDRWCYRIPPFGPFRFSQFGRTSPYLVLGLSIAGLVYAYGFGASFGQPQHVAQVRAVLAWIVWIGAIGITALTGFLTAILTVVFVLPADRRVVDAFGLVLPMGCVFATSLLCLLMIRQGTMSTFSTLWIIPLAVIAAAVWAAVILMFGLIKKDSANSEAKQ